ncbi:hypothetical protein C1645_55523 [Glomus cerebriforme]|uniref:Uncharacterized protein n=1 Tax=Glomus cerebriforme TaxID=658196 RepID=A0A397TQM3_9GLOM|nr:hypothetical protein C1645_55523 [Glomus cerebriforme]
MQVKYLIAKQESEIKESEQVVNEDDELEKEKNKIMLLQNEIENLKNIYETKINYLEEQVTTKENEIVGLKIKEKESLELKNHIFNLEKQLKEKEQTPQEKELLEGIDKIVKRFIMGPFGYASEVFDEEEIDEYYKEFETKDYSKYSPEIAQYGRFFSSQLRIFKSNVSIRKTTMRTIKELEDQKQHDQVKILKVDQLDEEKKEKIKECDNLAKQLNEVNNRVKLIGKAKLELEATLKREQKKLSEAKDMQIKELTVKYESQVKELENRVIDKDEELEKEKIKTRILQSELESNKVKITYLESQIKNRGKENVELKNQIGNLKKNIKEEKLKLQEKELLQRIDEIINKFITGPIDNAWEVYSEEEIGEYYKEFESKDYSQFSPEVALYGKFFLSQLRFFKYNLAMHKDIHKTKPYTVKVKNINKNFLNKRNDKFWSSFFFTLYISTYFKERNFYLIDKLNNVIVSDCFTKEKKGKLLETIKDENIFADIIKFLFRNGSDIIEDITEEDKRKVKEKILLVYGFYPHEK